MGTKIYLLTGTILMVCALGSVETQQRHPNKFDSSTQHSSPSPTPKPTPTPTRPNGPISPIGGGVRASTFGGTWTLDKSASQGMPSRFSNAESVAWIIKQDSQVISIEQKTTGEPLPGAAGGPPAGGAPGGGGRGGSALFGLMNRSTYKLNGTETTVDTGQGKITLKATWEGDSLNLVRKITFDNPEGEVTNSEIRTLEMSGDGKVLVVKVQTESPRGTRNSTLVFNKQ